MSVLGSSDELFGIRVHHPAYLFTPDLVVITVFCQTPVFAKKKVENFEEKNNRFIRLFVVPGQ